MRARPYIDGNTRLLITVPAYQSLFSSHDSFLGHYRRYSNGSLRRLIERSGFKVLDIGYFFGSLLPVRILQVIKERLFGLKPDQPTSGIVTWTGGDCGRDALQRRPSSRRARVDGNRKERIAAARAVELRHMRQVCLIVPCYNEERRLRRDTFLEFLRARPARESLSRGRWQFGWHAEHTRGLERLKGGGRILVQKLTKNSGKAEAVRQGVLYAASLERFSFLGYWDADLSTPLSQVDLLLAALEADPKRTFALGSRVKRLGSDIDRRAMRHYLGRVFSTMASQLFDLPVYDSQCGAKLFRSEVARPLFADPFVTKWLFDVELLVRLRHHLGQKEFLNASIEVPLTAWKEMGGSKLRLSHMLRVPIDLLRIRSRG